MAHSISVSLPGITLTLELKRNDLVHRLLVRASVAGVHAIALCAVAAIIVASQARLRFGRRRTIATHQISGPTGAAREPEWVEAFRRTA